MLAPVVARAPVLDQLLQIGEVGAVAPSGIAHLAGQARTRQTLAQIGQHFVGNRYGKFLDRTMRHRRSPFCPSPKSNRGRRASFCPFYHIQSWERARVTDALQAALTYLRASASLTISLASLPSSRAPN